MITKIDFKEFDLTSYKKQYQCSSVQLQQQFRTKASAGGKNTNKEASGPQLTRVAVAKLKRTAKIRSETVPLVGQLQRQCCWLPPPPPPSAAAAAINCVPVILFMILLSSVVSCVVVYQVRFIATKNGRTDYVLAGESIELSCHYIMKDEAEDIKQLIWSKDGKNFLKWRKNKPGLEVLSYTFKGHIDPESKLSHLTIHNVTIDMHGKYKCSIKTDLGTHEAEQDLIVISQSNCRLNDWRVISQPSQCREWFKFDCRNMFPKPVPSCGLWNGKLERFIRSVMVDIIEEPNKQTYRIRYTDKFDLKRQANGSILPIYSDLLQYAGHLMFKCDISVPDTSWKLSLVHKMFDYEDGCNQDPLEAIERMRQNYSQNAAYRMQQAGYLIEAKHLEDFEMLTSNLKYEIFPPPRITNGKNNNISSKNVGSSLARTPKSNANVELNCWQKPTIGSLARLSCSSKAPSNQIKLVGANLLECQPTGWVPVTESTPNLVQKQKLLLARMRQQQKLQPQRPATGKGRAVGAHNNDLITTTTRTNDSTDSLVSNRGDSNNLEEDDELNWSSRSRDTSQTMAVIATTEDEFIPTTIASVARDSVGEKMITIDDDDDDDSAVQSGNNNNNNNNNNGQHLSSAQMASLLPTCVSIRRNQPTDGVNTNKLPMLNEVSIMESSQQHPNNNQNRPKTSKHNQKSIFNFSSSGSNGGAIRKATAELRLHQALLILMVSLSFGLSIYTAMQQATTTTTATTKTRVSIHRPHIISVR